MLAVVKAPHIEIRGANIPLAFLKVVQEYFKKPVEIIEDAEESVNAFKTDWYKKVKASAILGDVVSVHRYKASMTQKKLGELLGISTQNVSELERGKRPVSLAMARKLAKVFRVDTAVFIS